MRRSINESILNLRIPAELKETLNEIADLNNVPLSNLVRVFLEEKVVSLDCGYKSKARGEGLSLPTKKEE